MKKTIIMIVVVLTTIITANAQFFAGGSLGVGYGERDHYNPDYVVINDFSFYISPKVGYKLNDNISIGTNVSLMNSITKHKIGMDIIEREDIRQQEWEVSIFGRYKLFEIKKLSLHIETPIGIGEKIRKEKTETITNKTFSESKIFINAFPLFLYDITDRFSLTATSSFFRLNSSFNRAKDYQNDKKHKYNYFGFNTNSSVFNSLSDIRIGFIYNF